MMRRHTVSSSVREASCRLEAIASVLTFEARGELTHDDAHLAVRLLVSQALEHLSGRSCTARRHSQVVSL